MRLKMLSGCLVNISALQTHNTRRQHVTIRRRHRFAFIAHCFAEAMLQTTMPVWMRIRLKVYYTFHIVLPSMRAQKIVSFWMRTRQSHAHRVSLSNRSGVTRAILSLMFMLRGVDSSGVDGNKPIVYRRRERATRMKAMRACAHGNR